MPRPPRIPLKLLPAALAAGAVLNVAVAWGAAVCTDLGHASFFELFAELPGEHHWEVYRWESLAGTRVFSKCWTGLAVGPYNFGDPADLLTSWGRIEPPDPPRAGAAVDEAWGLPMRTLRTHLVTGEPGEPGAPMPTTRHGVWLLREGRGFEQRAIFLPLLPIWLGLAVNTVVYALIVIVVHAVVRDVRAAMGQRRLQPIAEA